MTLAERLRFIRARKKMTVAEAAAVLGMVRSQLYDLESGKTKTPNYKTMCRLVEAYGVDPREFFDWQPPPPFDGRPTVNGEERLRFGNDGKNYFRRGDLMVNFCDPSDTLIPSDLREKT